jgi:hypothetical protein
MMTYCEPPEGLRTLTELPDTDWGLNIYAKRDRNSWQVIIGVGMDGAILKKGLSRKAALAYVAAYALPTQSTP